MIAALPPAANMLDPERKGCSAGLHFRMLVAALVFNVLPRGDIFYLLRSKLCYSPG